MRDRFLLVGLGNPGKKYAKSRHNIGFMVIDEIAKRFARVVKSKADSFVFSECEYFQKHVILIKPLTFMNLSGIAVASAKQRFDVDNSQLLIIHDDLYLPFGKLRLRIRGSDAGNKGIASIIDYLQTQEFPRLKIGIGSKCERDELVEYVLAPFSKEEFEVLDSIIIKAADASLCFLKEGAISTMNAYN
ncbi:aminoacyl-tRNA hydrolase [candidate division KSB1 bacterium]|nr:aminoacyl-tRNA hydrolase [candidate division KSB1 bacterium]